MCYVLVNDELLLLEMCFWLQHVFDGIYMAFGLLCCGITLLSSLSWVLAT